jgi:hypothetical protein
MNDASGVWVLFARRGILDDVEGAWVLVAVGALFLLVGVFNFLSGRIRAGYRGPGGIGRSVDLDGEQHPIQFLVRVMIALLSGTGLITYGVWKLVV